eukprot:TRINITY_DN12498_c0_g1_i1.p1 TRINITY_DN12498_c0_g1~~TRINITY_DN12498_c0_g1_i1.p1  ORF type:complete len:141 (+),score=23.81 TRINITY_DN12498_c0_g1_i1:55-477(+)
MYPSKFCQDFIQNSAQINPPKSDFSGAPERKHGCEEMSQGQAEQFCVFSEDRLVSLLGALFKEFFENERAGKTRKSSKGICGLIGLKVVLLQFSDTQFQKHLKSTFPLFINLIHCESLQIRTLVASILERRVNPLLQSVV